MMFRRQSIPSILLLSAGLAIISSLNSFNSFVSAQQAQSNAERVEQIRSLISQDQKIINICPNDIGFDLKGEQLRIITKNHVCSYKIMQNVLKPQFQAGKINSYDFSDDQEDLVVTFDSEK